MCAASDRKIRGGQQTPEPSESVGRARAEKGHGAEATLRTQP